MGARSVLVTAFACLLGSAAPAQEASVFVVVKNPTDAALALQVEDQVCGGTAFDGVLEGSSILTLALCADESGHARLVMTDPADGQVSQHSVSSGGSVVAP